MLKRHDASVEKSAGPRTFGAWAKAYRRAARADRCVKLEEQSLAIEADAGGVMISARDADPDPPWVID